MSEPSTALEHEHEREFTRSSTRCPVEVLTDEAVVEGTLRDVGLRGMFVQCDNPLPPGVLCRIRIRLAGDDPSQLYTPEIRAHGETVRSDPAGMAVHFNDIDPESFDHLKRLVLFNSTKPDAIEREISNHLGLMPRTAADAEPND